MELGRYSTPDIQHAYYYLGYTWNSSTDDLQKINWKKSKPMFG